MRCLIPTIFLLVLWSGHGPAQAGTACPDMQRPYPALAGEVAEIVSEWFIAQGYTVRRNQPRPGTEIITSWNLEEGWQIVVRPQSPLASTVAIEYENVMHADRTCRRLRDHIDGQLMGHITPPSVDALPHPQTAPAPVYDAVKSVVCIRTNANSRAIQFSGFLIDPDGLILCTAHDLDENQRVTLTFSDGTSKLGWIAHIDADLDLALIACAARNRPFVPLSDGRSLLESGETVFSVGCPDNQPGQLSSGIVDGPPRRLDNRLLWQVIMRIDPGSSGSPVFDDRGRLVAMVKGRFRGSSTVGFLTPLDTIMDFLLKRRP